jgi:hypothetical protein
MRGSPFFTRCYSSSVVPSFEAAKAFAVDNDGNWDYVTIQYLKSGPQAWLAHYDGPGSGQDYAKAIAVD